MEFKTISIENKNLFDQYLKNINRDLISYCFSSLFIWREWEPFYWCELENTLCVSSNYNNRFSYLVPISPDKTQVLKAVEALIEYQKDQDKPFLLSEVTEDLRAFFEQVWPGRFVAEECRDGANYIYRASDLIQLSGRNYASKRNHIHQFIRNYPHYRLLPLSEDLVPACREALHKWCEFRAAENPDILLECKSACSAMANLDKLDANGACLLVDNKVAAFTIGEALDEKTVGIHFEKADTNFIGAYAVINQFYLRDYWSDMEFVNRAEDMGSPGLRRAKESYHPLRLANKYYLRLAE